MSDFVNRTKQFMSTPLFKVILIGLIIRIIMIPFCLAYDSNYWTIVIRNIESGNGLYQVEGYYYTPVWGYILAFVSGIQNAFFDIGDLSVVCYDLFSYVSIGQYAYSDMALSIVFLFNLKVILTISDLVLSILVYKLVKDRTGDEKKAVIAFFLVFVCPHVLGSSSMVTMPDTLSAMFTILTIVLLKDDRYFFAGITYALAVWVKFFPIAIILVIICYVYAGANGDVRKAFERIGKSFLGFMLISVIIFFPQFMEGTLPQSLAFLTDRVSEIIRWGILSILGVSLIAVAISAISIAVGKHMLRSKGDREDRLMEYSMILLSVCMLLYTNLQYLVTLIPFLVYCIMVVNDRYKWIWILLAVVGAFLTLMLNTNAVMLNSLAVFTDMISVSFATSLFDFLNEEIIANEFSIVDIFCSTGNLLQRVCLIMVPLVFVGCRLYERRMKKATEQSSDE